jgi:energy-coupling factor transport system permease protein
LFTLPRIDLPEMAAGISLLGPVSAEALLAGFYDGLRLATMIVCVGAANALANPKRLLAAVPSALYEAGTVLVVSVSVFPQLAESVGRVRRARALRGGPRGRRHLLRAIIIPVLTDALDRSMLLAASMDSRGYGRIALTDRRSRHLTSTLLIIGLLGVGVGAYGLLDATSPGYLGTPLLIGGIVLGAFGFRLAGDRVRRTRYRPERWGAAEWLVSGCGILGAVGVFSGPVAELYPSANPLMWPAFPLLAGFGILIALVPAARARPA